MGRKDTTLEDLLNQPDWNAERKRMRAILLECGLEEAVKWGQLCYMFNGSNLAILFGLKDYCGIGFFKGALLKDPGGILHRQGEHSQAMRLIRFTSAAQISGMEDVVKAYVADAIDLEKAGLKVDFKEKRELVYPEELQARLESDPALGAAFEALTPGRQRGYVLHVSGAKQSATRAARVEKCVPRILDGKGMHDR